MLAINVTQRHFKLNKFCKFIQLICKYFIFVNSIQKRNYLFDLFDLWAGSFFKRFVPKNQLTIKYTQNRILRLADTLNIVISLPSSVSQSASD